MRNPFRLCAVLALTAFVAACGASATTAPLSTPSAAIAPPPSTAGDLPAAAVAACANTTYTGCLKAMALAVSVFGGELVAVCEYDNGTGDVVLIDKESDAEAKCSGSGTFNPSRVVATFRLP